MLTYVAFEFLFHVFCSPEHKVLKVSYCDRPLSVVRRRPSSVVRRRPSSVVLKLFYLIIFSSETTHWILTQLKNGPWVVPHRNCLNMVLIGCIRRSRGKKQVLKMQFSKIFLSKTTRPRAFIFGIQHHLEALYQSCSNYAPLVKIDPAPGVTI